jgi:O-antigen ligase
VLEISRNKKTNIPIDSYSKVLFLLYLVYFLWQLVSILYSENSETGWNILFSRLSLILFPIVLTMPGEKILKNIKILLKLFSISTAIFVLFCYFHSLIVSISFINGNIVFNPHPPEGYWMSYFFGNYFSFNQHPSYLAMYVIFSAIFSFESGFDVIKKSKARYLWFGMGIFLLISLYFLSSRSGFLASIILIPVYFIYRFRNNRKRIFLVLLVIVFVLIPVFTTNERVKIVIDEVSNDAFMKLVKEDGRLNVWESAVRIIRQNTLLGVGIGDVRDELHKEYVKIGDQDLIDNNYNVHNQFLEVFVESGIVGLFLFFLILLIALVISFRTGNKLLALFVLMMIIFFMFETVLYRLAGVAFFSLFPFLLLYYPLKQK